MRKVIELFCTLFFLLKHEDYWLFMLPEGRVAKHEYRLLRGKFHVHYILL
jgi:hypothetical protein